MRLNLYLVEAENTLSDLSIIPVIGTIPAIVKIALGCIQTVSGALVGITGVMYFPSSIVNDNNCSKMMLNFSFTHIKHGIGNCVAGVLEGIPILGTIIVIKRRLKLAAYDSGQEAYENRQNNVAKKFYKQKMNFLEYPPIPLN